MTTILVVEDEFIIREYVQQSLQDEGYDVIAAKNADQAITILEAHLDIAIVFTDIDMPGSMDGLKLAACVRDRWPPVHIIIASGHRSPSETDLPAGAKIFRKPFDFPEVVKAIESFS